MIDFKVFESHVHVYRKKLPTFTDYVKNMPSMNIDGAILSQNIGNPDNEYLIDCANSDLANFRVVAIWNYEDPLILSKIRNLSETSAVVGMRLWSTTSSSLDDPLAIWRTIYESGLIASVRGPLRDINSSFFRNVLKEFPELKFRIEHLGSFKFSQDSKNDFAGLLELAELPNVYLMWAGYYANSDRPYPYEDAHPFLALSLKRFGSSRIMWSGDWNQDTENGDSKGVRLSAEMISDQITRSGDDLDDSWNIFQGTARKFFGI